MGEEGFAAGLKGYVKGYETIVEIPRGQRLIGRPSLKQLFGAGRQSQTQRDRLIEKAVKAHGYSQVEVARHLKIHYSTLSRIMKRVRQDADEQ